MNPPVKLLDSKKMRPQRYQFNDKTNAPRGQPTIADRLAIFSSTGKFLLAQILHRQLYRPLFEKSMAKLNFGQHSVPAEPIFKIGTIIYLHTLQWRQPWQQLLHFARILAR
ncbi:hypothetical protein [Burkholderia thailandensis]|uniref:hypothetical protein n=1 Tax=Burkholderia thailandensis TaxID=57975 RepID=UPI0011AEDB94|nr:hypothetical protein [Burkholderia thailandensis]MCS3396417.1 hypothetical protein [Burkholderia thailandensis]MCS6469738.1 hypothetical protein [Burkholderia thailandensis]QIO14817.1 hypothetical protein G9462_23000 [Burkholderia thailandensis]QRA13884.1 hypothetical protein JMY07_17475 [Burkholderia thailandensis]WRS69051.1 hypothetical protein U9S59_20060 [Burkholderia thailandensis]